MLKNRLVAVVLLRDGQVVQSVRFKHTNIIHYDPVHAVDSFNRWAVDEMVMLNVSRDEKTKSGFIHALKQVSKSCFVPLAAGGWVDGGDYANELLVNGADKVVVNTEAFRNPELISDLAGRFGSQAVVVSIDAKPDTDMGWQAVVDRGRVFTGTDAVVWAQKAVDLGAGELLINSIDHDGNRKGYDLELIREVASRVSVPVIAMGGVFHWKDLADGVQMAGADAVAAANIFHYTEQSTKYAKKYLLEQGFGFRPL